ncbi:MAG TPA: diaminopimelate epimerase [Acidimicrobiales bacterium]|nr:diaminopimelate epimerase [Acidimicrobiales bacterium]
MAGSGARTFTKHHGAGNDFLVLLDPPGRSPLSAREVAALCDRHHGVGADGVIRVSAGGPDADLAMDLRNADGTVAAMSGNGIRCLVQAAVDGAMAEPGTVTVHTLAGVRRVTYRALGPGEGHGRVAMGPVRLGPEETGLGVPGVVWAQHVDVGNPHLVLFGAVAGDDTVARHGAALERSVPGGTNVEFVWAGPGAELVLRVVERGVGETLACGTGACAVVAAAHAHGVVGTTARVRSPGGTLEVELEEDGEGGVTAVLAGPTVRVAEVVVDPAALAARAGGAVTEVAGRR